MKKIILYILFIISLAYIGCDKPGPTELIDDPTDSDLIEVQIIGKDLENEEYYSSGYDTSGVTEDLLRYTSIISVSGIKLTRGAITDRISSAQAIIFDKSKPFKTPNGVTIGYNTIVPGIIKFDDAIARISNFRIRYRESGNLIDTVLGKKYELFNLNGRLIYDPFNYPYASSINFSYNPFFGGQNSSFNILTPQEVTGSLKVLRQNNQNDFNVEVSWNSAFVDSFSIIIGGVRTLNQKVFPFYKIKTKDDGKLIISSSLLKNIPRDRFDKITITLVRKYDKLTSLQNSDLYVVSQSIHTIIVDIP